MTVTGPCRLCGKTTTLIESHIVPSNIIKWLKDTSATGRLRRSHEPNRPLQDGLKAFLMCEACDGGLLGPKEKQFKEKVFLPYHQDRTANLTYTGDLHYFAASLSFRVILLEVERQAEREGLDFRDFDKPLPYLRRYLQGMTDKRSGLEHFVLLTNEGENFIRFTENENFLSVERGLPDELGFHLMRSVDSFAFYLDDHLMTLVQLPGFIFVTVLKPRRYKGHLGAPIQPQGGTLSFRYADLMRSDLFPFLAERSRQFGAARMSPEQAAKTKELVKRFPERWERSETSRLIHLLNR